MTRYVAYRPCYDPRYYNSLEFYDRNPRQCIAPKADGTRCGIYLGYEDFLEAARLRELAQRLPDSYQRDELIEEYIKTRGCKKWHQNWLRGDVPATLWHVLVPRYREELFGAGRRIYLRTTTRVIQYFVEYKLQDRESIKEDLLDDIPLNFVASGLVYTFTWPKYSDYTKVGYTGHSVVDVRLQAWEKCHPGLQLRSQMRFPWPARFERLIHLELVEFRHMITNCESRSEECRGCHIEWFKKPWEQAHEVIVSWSQLNQRDPLYTLDGRLSIRWFNRLKPLVGKITAAMLHAILDAEDYQRSLEAWMRLQIKDEGIVHKFDKIKSEAKQTEAVAVDYLPNSDSLPIEAQARPNVDPEQARHDHDGLKRIQTKNASITEKVQRIMTKVKRMKAVVADIPPRPDSPVNEPPLSAHGIITQTPQVMAKLTTIQGGNERLSKKVGKITSKVEELLSSMTDLKLKLDNPKTNSQVPDQKLEVDEVVGTHLGARLESVQSGTERISNKVGRITSKVEGLISTMTDPRFRVGNPKTSSQVPTQELEANKAVRGENEQISTATTRPKDLVVGPQKHEEASVDETVSNDTTIEQLEKMIKLLTIRARAEVYAASDEANVSWCDDTLVDVENADHGPFVAKNKLSDGTETPRLGKEARSDIDELVNQFSKNLRVSALVKADLPDETGQSAAIVEPLPS